MTLTLVRGMETEAADEYGYLTLLGTLLFRGCGKFDRRAFAHECDRRGANLDVYPGRDLFTIEAWVLPEDLEWALGMVRQIIFEPHFDEAEVEVARQEQLLQLQARDDEKRSLLVDTCRRQLFLEDHHYSRPLLGSIESLEGVDRTRVAALHERLLSGVSAVLCVTGGFRHEELLRHLDRCFGGDEFSPRQEIAVEKSVFQSGTKRDIVIPFPVDQTEVLIAFPGVRRTDPDYRLASFCNEVYGGAFLSRLTRAVRMEEGMAYSVESRLQAGLAAGVFWVGLQTDRSNLTKALETVRRCTDDLRQNGIDKEEFLHFKEFLRHSTPFEYDGFSALTSRRLEEILFGDPWPLEIQLQEIERVVTLEATNRFLSERLDCDRALVGVLGEDLKVGAADPFHRPAKMNGHSSGLAIVEGPKAPKSAPAKALQVASDRRGALYRLPSGIHLLVLPRPEFGAVSLQVWSLTGSIDEKAGETGLSHLLEHLMFRGTERYPDGEFDAILAQKGGLNNAFTSEDFTVYLNYVNPDGLEEALCLEADRFRSLDLTEEIFKTELAVVLEERSLRVDYYPLGMAYELLQELAFPDHPYKYPVIGWREDLEALDLDTLRAHYDLARRPERLMVVIAGGCSVERGLDLTERAFGEGFAESDEAGTVDQPEASVEPLWPVPPPREVEPLESASVHLSERSGYSYLLMGYHFPREGHPDFEVCELLTRIIGEGDSCLLYDYFVRETRQAMEVWVGYESQARDHPLLYIGFANAGPIDEGLVGEVAEFLSDLSMHLTEDTLEKVRRNWVAQEAFGADELEDWAVEIAGRVMLMPWDEVWKNRERVDEITLDLLRSAAAHYLARDRFVHVVLQGTSETEKES